MELVLRGYMESMARADDERGFLKTAEALISISSSKNALDAVRLGASNPLRVIPPFNPSWGLRIDKFYSERLSRVTNSISAIEKSADSLILKTDSPISRKSIDGGTASREAESDILKAIRKGVWCRGDHDEILKKIKRSESLSEAKRKELEDALERDSNGFGRGPSRGVGL